jgi:hypothetical protein
MDFDSMHIFITLISACLQNFDSTHVFKTSGWMSLSMEKEKKSIRGENCGYKNELNLLKLLKLIILFCALTIGSI